MAGKPYTMDVELGKIREFARATRSNNPAYLRSDRPFAPPTFLVTSAFWSGPEGAAWDSAVGEVDLARVLHGGEEFVFHGEPPRAGTRLVAQARPGRTYTKQGRRGGEMRFAEIITEFRTTDGRLVAEKKTTMIITGRPPTQADGADPAAAATETAATGAAAPERAAAAATEGGPQA